MLAGNIQMSCLRIVSDAIEHPVEVPCRSFWQEGLKVQFSQYLAGPRVDHYDVTLAIHIGQYFSIE